ncbi:hypothetical protein HanRHA438_Chr15g0685811 [Helianthus annuus]|nr:hypothetical protein HanRHA438_Chr15g0685811 [Helianthus annuus]
MIKQTREPYVSLKIESERGEASQTGEQPVEGDPVVIVPVPVAGTSTKKKCKIWCEKVTSLKN